MPMFVPPTMYEASRLYQHTIEAARAAIPNAPLYPDDINATEDEINAEIDAAENALNAAFRAHRR